MAKNSPADATPNMRSPAIVALLAQLDQIVEQGARHLRPEVAPHVQIGLEPAGLDLRLEAQRMIGPAGDPVVDIGAKVQRLARDRRARP